MSQGIACRCQPADRTTLVVVQRESNHSAFNGWHQTRSAYSEIRCIKCSARWRTKAAYVKTLPDAGRNQQ